MAGGVSCADERRLSIAARMRFRAAEPRTQGCRIMGMGSVFGAKKFRDSLNKS
jgi:hypothetical protein